MEENVILDQRNINALVKNNVERKLVWFWRHTVQYNFIEEILKIAEAQNVNEREISYDIKCLKNLKGVRKSKNSQKIRQLAFIL